MLSFLVRQTRPEDFDQIIDLTRRVYLGTEPWRKDQLASHLSIFPEGQLVAVDKKREKIVGFAACLIVFWDIYDMATSWKDFTSSGMFTNHDPKNGRTLYGAEILVDPELQGKGIGSLLYKARRELARKLGLLRIRAGARLRGYSQYISQMTPEEYVLKVIRGESRDPTLSFQLKHDFHVLDVVSNYLRHDPESRGFAAVIEWINMDVAKLEDYQPYLTSKFNVSPKKFQ